MSEDLVQLSATALVAALRRRELRATDLLEAYLERQARLHPRLNAVVSSDPEAARAAARGADAALDRGEPGALLGLPMTVKDTFATAGLRTTFGLPHTQRHVPARDAAVVARLRAAGAVIWGKTNLPLASFDWQTRNPWFGVANNPWDVGRTPGGSSGGSAAAVAARLSPLEIGSDVAGSIRVPCHFCGVAGLRPTEGGSSSFGHSEPPGWPRALRSLLACGPIARDVGDLRLLWSVVGGACDEDWSVAPVVAAPGAVALRGLRVAVSPTLGGVPVAAEVAAAFDALVGKLRGAGCVVSPLDPADHGLDFAWALEVWGAVLGPEMRAMGPWGLRLPVWDPALRLGAVQAMFGRGRFARALGRGLATGLRGYFEARTRRDAYVAAAEAMLRPYDAWLAPAAPIPAFTHRRTGAPLDIDGERHGYGDALAAYTCPIALMGCPAVALPIGCGARSGLPIGVQIAGPRFSDARLLAIAEQIEALAGKRTTPDAALA